MNLREKIAIKRAEQEGMHWERYPEDSWTRHLFFQQADQILTLLQKHIEKLGVISDEEIMKIYGLTDMGDAEFVIEKDIAQAQLQYIKDELGKEMK